MGRPSIRRTGAAAGMLALATGCGYGLGYRTPPAVLTIAVPLFQNNTFPLRREVEYDLTRAVRREIQSRTQLVLTDHDEADLVIHGTVSDFQERVIAEGRQDQKIESSIFLEALLVVEDHRNRKRWEERLRVSEPLSIESGETLEVARTRAIGNLAERILEVIEYWDDEEPVPAGAGSGAPGSKDATAAGAAKTP